MTAIFGPIGSGKTTLLTFIMAMMEQALSEVNGAVVFFDKDRGGSFWSLLLVARILFSSVVFPAALRRCVA